MKTEDFDDAIRKKLDRIERFHKTTEVDAIHRHIVAKRNFRSKKNIILLSSALVLILGGLFTWNILQVKEISMLKQRVAQLKDGSKAHRAGMVSTQVRLSENFHDKYKQGAGVLNVENNDRSSSSSKARGFNIINKNPKEGEKLRRAVVNPEKEINSTSSSKKVEIAIVEEQIPEINALPILTKDSEYVSQSVVTMGEPAEILSFSDSSSNKVITNQDHVISATHLEASPDLSSDSIPALRPPHPNPVRDWHYGVGASFEVGRLQMGVALLGEAVFKKKWAISFGLKLVKNGTQNFDDDDDYHDKKKHEFHNVYSGHVSDSSNKNIAIKNLIIQMPLHVNYAFPIKKDFAVLAGAGTDIDLYIRQDIDYKHAASPTDYQNKKFAVSSPPVFLNNVVFTIGMQKTIHHLTFELSPYISPQIKTVDYKKENLYYGLKFRTFFIF